MSLGVKSLWRAQTRSVCIKELCLGPVSREHHDNPRRWLSFSAASPDHSGNGAKADEHREDHAGKKPQRTRTSPNPTRRLIKRAIKLRKSNPDTRKRPSVETLIKPAARYPSKHGTIRSLRKHFESANRQHIHDFFIQAFDKPNDDWGSTLYFLLANTPDSQELFSLKVVIGRGASREARRVLSGLDNNIGQIERRHQSNIKFEESFPDPEMLVLNISGSEIAVRDSLRDIINVSGKVTAVRVREADLKERLGDIWKTHRPGQPLALDDDDGELDASDTTMTIQTDRIPQLDELARPSRYKSYVLKERADNITPPAEWTKISFDRYVAALVHGVMPTDLARKLYRNGPSHQETVVSLLVTIFESQDTRSAVSVSALKMALAYIHAKGAMFRPATRRIFTRAEELGLPLDAETFGLFLASASRAGDINNFNSIMRLMLRKRFYLQSHAWYAFLEMTQHAKAKRIIIYKMEQKGLHRIPVFSIGMARQLALIDLLRTFGHGSVDMDQFVETYDWYGTGGTKWLNTTTVNKLLDMLGQYGRLGACHGLLEYIHKTGRSVIDVYTLNTMLTHTRTTPFQAILLRSIPGRWPWVKPDDTTYNMLFAIAWGLRRPNTLRVLWRYALLHRCLSSKVRHRIITLLRSTDRNSSNRRSLLKAWVDVIVGRAELTGEPEEKPEKLEEERDRKTAEDQGSSSAAHYEQKQKAENAPPLSQSDYFAMEKQHLAQANGRKPSDILADKLMEAYEMDLEIHKLIKAGTVLTPAMQKQLTVDIPLREAKKAEEADTVNVENVARY
ncbi:hypothetical protein SLS62_001981 [Diatrype stigma]|uniref:Pentatricopeptide repeat protein n=1 Tax=Diatrype stigma TaxID=117547 RepID=A0AAN9V9K2_9PEZI